MISFGTYEVEVVHAALAQAGEDSRAVLPDGRTFKATSHRMILFATTTVNCTKCGLQGLFYRLEAHRPNETPHLNLYGVSLRGKVVLMTKDHTIPRSKGGTDTLDNYKTMCYPCNNKKGNQLP